MNDFTDEEYTRARQANADRDELQECQDQLAEAQSRAEIAEALAVWAVRWNADTDSASTGERWLIWGHDERNRIRVDGTDADILRALKEAKGNGDR